MNPLLLKQFKAQLDAAIAGAEAIRKDPRNYGQWQLIGGDSRTPAASAACVAAVERVAGKDSVYARRIAEHRGFTWAQFQNMLGVTVALRADLEAGYLDSVSELVHAEVFADFLEMAGHLLTEGYKDPAAIIAGAALETHLRQLCIKHNVPHEAPDSGGAMRPKKADRMNGDLAKAGAYAALDQKSVTMWLDLRNKAAHGRFTEYTGEQVGNMLSGIIEFIARLPA